MSVIGGFPLAQLRRRTIRAPVNPLDKSTIVSIYPREIDERKHTIQPGRFIIPPGSYDSPSVLVVGPSSWWREIDEEQPLLEIPNSSIQVAESVVTDYCNGLLGSNMTDTMPGIFYIPGALTVNQLKKEYVREMEKAKGNQVRWYQRLINLANVGWARTGGNPLCISDDMRLAAKELALSNLDWMKDFQAFEQVRCIACGALRNPSYPVCQTCKAVADPVKAKELNLQFAQ